MVNKVMILGRLTRDVEVTSTPNGKSVAEISLAVNDGKDANGNERVEFFNIQVWDRQADFLGEYYGEGRGKGQPLFVEASLRTDKWDDKATGEKRSKLKIVATSVKSVPSSPSKGVVDDGEVSEKPAKATKATKAEKKPKAVVVPVAEDDGDDDEDIPF